ncbi:MAG TPA: hypothetical protein VNI57_05435 [Candidatus Saccharimonadales bacterium]|nr:hypothetical protein [Candidatus Saccharimonadales bacterium]
MEAAFPTLAEHRCCGANSLRESLFGGRRRRGCSVTVPDPGVDAAHLLEHLIIDIQHYVGRMRICSGVTCAYHDPPDRYDIFVECPEEKVGLLSASIAVGVLVDLMAGQGVNPHYRRIMETARRARDLAGTDMRSLSEEYEAGRGAERISEAIDYLRLQGFLTEIPAGAGEETKLSYVP